MNEPLHRPAPPAIRGAEERLLTAEDLIAMSEAGVFAETEHVDLIDGRLWVRPSDGIGHMRATGGAGEAVQRLLIASPALSSQWILIPNASIRISDHRLFSADWAVISRAAMREERLPQPEDVALVIEAADTSLAFDEGDKKEIYAEAGIRELWIVRVAKGDARVCREPGADGVWGFDRIFGADETVAPRFAPGAAISVRALLGGGK